MYLFLCFFFKSSHFPITTVYRRFLLYIPTLILILYLHSLYFIWCWMWYVSRFQTNISTLLYFSYFFIYLFSWWFIIFNIMWEGWMVGWWWWWWWHVNRILIYETRRIKKKRKMSLTCPSQCVYMFSMCIIKGERPQKNNLI